jgi:hypothetical protein
MRIITKGQKLSVAAPGSPSLAPCLMRERCVLGNLRQRSNSSRPKSSGIGKAGACEDNWSHRELLELRDIEELKSTRFGLGLEDLQR